MARILVTGGSGFTGQRVVRALIRRGHTVAGLARRPEAAAILDGLGAEALEGDLNRSDELVNVARGYRPDVMISITPLISGHAPLFIEAAQQSGSRRVVVTSTTSVHTKLNAPSKPIRLKAEEVVKNSGLDWTIIRPSMIYGAPGDRNMERLLKWLHRYRFMILPGGGNGLQQPVHVEDLAEVIARAVDLPCSIGQAYDVAGPTPLPFREVVHLAGEAIGRKPKALSIPFGLMLRTARIYHRVSRKPRIRPEQIERLAEDKAFSIEKAQTELSHHPRSFARGIAQEAQALGLAPTKNHPVGLSAGVTDRTLQQAPESGRAHGMD